LIEASHDGYNHLGVHCHRRFEYTASQVAITDDVGASRAGTSYFHFSTAIELQLRGNTLHSEFAVIEFQNASAIESEAVLFSTQYNLFETGTCYKISFTEQLKTIIKIHARPFYN